MLLLHTIGLATNPSCIALADPAHYFVIYSAPSVCALATA